MIKDYHTICKEIYKMAKKTPTAVFAICGDVIMIPYDSDRCKLYLKLHPNSFVGVYNNKVTRKMIQEDIL